MNVKGIEMYFVYFLKSNKEGYKEKTYIGMTNNVIRRFKEHNLGNDSSVYTFRYKPWVLVNFVLTDTEETAEIVERYWKNSSGKEKIQRFAEENPKHLNPVNGYFSSLEVGKSFGSGQNRFKVVESDGIPLFSK